jgi:hypothetical protein
MPSVVLLPLAPPPAPPGAAATLEAVERETASRLGPFAWLQATGGTAGTVVIESTRSNAPVGGYEGLWLLRRDAVRANDRVRTVDRVDGASGSLVVDFPYEDAPVAGEWVELHHLHPDQQLRPDVLAGLRRCYVLDVAALPPPEGGGRTVDATATAFWLTSVRQLLGVAVDGRMIPQAERWGRGGEGWTAYGNRGRVYLVVPAGTAATDVRAYRDAFGIVNGLDDPRGPLDDLDEVGVPVAYAAALAHIEAWRRHSDRLEASAAEGRFATQEMASAEASRTAATFADFLFRPQTERGDSIASPWGSSYGGSVNGLGGSGALAAAVVNKGW